MLRMSSGSLLKRKFRTVLTVLGVMIGTASIVVMVSLGLGINRAQMETIEKYGGLTTIEVREGRNESRSAGGGSVVIISSSSSSNDVKRIDDAAVETLKGLAHVTKAYPVLNYSAIAKYGPYETMLSIQAMPPEGIEDLNIEVGEGYLPTSSDELELFYGNRVAADFYNPKTYSYPYYETGEYAVDLSKDTLFIILDQSAYFNSPSGSNSSGGNTAPPKKYIFKTAGIEKASPEGEWSQNGYSVFCNLEALETTLKRVFRNKAIPGQPTGANGKPYKVFYYSRANVVVDDISNVTQVQEAINSLGYSSSSNIEWIQSTQEQMANIQALLGGIGAVSLLVAAIGITNTMMMSIYERTKEIGVMKVLGCDMRNIQALFLIEAAYIGFIGGLVGLGLSYAISTVINRALAAGGESTVTSYIPPWLAAAALVFAVIIGMVAGFFPSRRAMRLSPLAAIRNE